MEKELFNMTFKIGDRVRVIMPEMYGITGTVVSIHYHAVPYEIKYDVSSLANDSYLPSQLELLSEEPNKIEKLLDKNGLIISSTYKKIDELVEAVNELIEAHNTSMSEREETKRFRVGDRVKHNLTQDIGIVERVYIADSKDSCLVDFDGVKLEMYFDSLLFASPIDQREVFKSESEEKPKLGDYDLKALTQESLRAMMNEMFTRGRGKGISEAYDYVSNNLQTAAGTTAWNIDKRRILNGLSKLLENK